MELKIRKVIMHVERIHLEMGKPVDPPLEMIAVAAAIENPYAGRGFVENLRPEILALAPELAGKLAQDLLKYVGGADRIEAYGKAAVVGINGDIEHASAFIHTLRFGNIYRKAVGGKSFLHFTNKRGGPGALITIPMIHKIDPGQRPYFLTMELTIGDAPGPDEIVVAIGAATRSRPHPRTGDRYQDMAEMGDDAEGKPSQP